MIDQLTQVIQATGNTVHLYTSPDESRLLLLPRGARILGLAAPGSDENFYWANPALLEADSARELFGRGDWQNTGGDRTWLAPELDIFFPDYPDTRRAAVPTQLDAGQYLVRSSDGGVAMSRRISLHFARVKRDIELELTKSVGPAANPLRYERDLAEVAGAVAYAGYTQRTTLALGHARDAEAVRVGIWNLIQLPHGGDFLVPTYRQAQARVLFGEISAEHLVYEDHLVRFRAGLPGEHKIAVRAFDTTGRAGYLWQSGDQWSLVVRNFFVNPSGEYVDVPKDDPDDLGYAFHAVNVDSALGEFCELEYHAPAIGGDAQTLRGEDVSCVWAFRGPEPEIRTIAQRLLGAS